MDPLAQEQPAVDLAYNSLDAARREYRAQQRRVEAEGAFGSPQARTERDAIAAHFGDEAARLEALEDRLVFGRLDTEDGLSLHVGRVGLFDDAGSQVLVDWRARAAMPFYRATSAVPMGVWRRRHIGTRRRQVISVEDDLLDVQAADKVSLAGEGALMAALSQGRSGHMHDIVTTIQSEQDRVIRADAPEILVVQGGPGTGKTAVALHRAAYLLYADRERLAKAGVLVIGPSRQFLRYIEKVLPALGETGVVARTIAQLVPGLSVAGTDDPAVARLKGRLAWRQVVRLAVASRRRVPASPVRFEVSGVPLVLYPEDVRAAAARADLDSAFHNEARTTFALALLGVLTDQFLAEGGYTKADRGWAREELRSHRLVRRHINLCWMPTDPVDLLERLYARPDFLRSVSDFSADELRLLYRPAGSPFTPADVPIVDELAELLGPLEVGKAVRNDEDETARAALAIKSQDLGGGIVNAQMLAERALGEAISQSVSERAGADRSWTFGHIVVDEAQELSPLQWHMLLRRCPTRSFTVVGDLAQKSVGTVNTWEDALGPAARADVRTEVLSVCYRTPAQIMRAAQRTAIALGRKIEYPVTAVRSVSGSYVVEKTADILGRARQIVTEFLRTFAEQTGQVAVISKNGAFVTGITDGRVHHLAAAETKGLEYDLVVLVEPGEMCDRPGDLYVAMTRPTQKLHVLHQGPLPAGMDPNIADYEDDLHSPHAGN
ncbi:MAG: AAA family ATPase [Actinomycetaceae bacterium]|nr:AAA family ATPase [Actinomycetaceae bacterium]